MRRWHRLNKNGVTFLELMLVVVTVSIVVAAIPLTFRSGTNIWDKGDSHAEAMQNGLIGIDDMTRNLRQAYSVTSVSNPSDTQGYIQYKEDEDSEDDSRYEYYQAAGSEYLRRGVPDALNPLTEPVESLTFTGYERDGVTPTTNPANIASVQMQLVTPAEQDRVNPIPLTSRVYLRARDYPPPPYMNEFALFGAKGTTIENRSYVGLNNPESNVGSNGTIEILNNSTVNGALVYYVDLDLSNPNNPPVTTGPYINTYTLLPCPTSFSTTGVLGDITAGTTLPRAGDVSAVPGEHHYHYNDLDIGNNEILTLTGGAEFPDPPPAGLDPRNYYYNYYFRSFSVKNNFTLLFDLSNGGGVNVFVEGKVRIGSTLTGDYITSAPQGMTEEEAAACIYFETSHPQADYEVAQEDGWRMGQNAYWLGGIYAPYSNVYLTDGIMKGCVYSGCGYAELSGGAYAPAPTGYTEIDYVRNIYLSSRPYNCVWDCPPGP